MDAIELRNNARHQLMEITTLETGMDYLNKVKSIEVWAKAEKMDAEMQNLIAEQKLRTQRILGNLIRQGQEVGELATKGESNYNSLIPEGNKRTLSDIGITSKQSSAFQQIASIPEDDFESFISEKKERVNQALGELTTSAALKLAQATTAKTKMEEGAKEEISEEEARIMERAKAGETVVINMNKHFHVLKYAQENGLYVRIDRSSEWGNPFILGEDGDRERVCELYQYSYFFHKRGLKKKAAALKGKVLGCHCYPLECHGDTLVAFAEEGNGIFGGE